MPADLDTAKQIVALLQGPAGAIWELVTAERPRRPTDIAIRDARGLAVLYARRAAA
ncbi:MAG TPA: hypothetical protein VKZ60_17500 [Chloroflexota bacterium]|jgi:hypothetical protein|nr:hypothetical protein [Chloroflexota bacterium]